MRTKPEPDHAQQQRGQTAAQPIHQAQMTLVIFGAGGHGRVVADAALCAAYWQVVATDRNPALCQGQLLPGVSLVAIQEAQPQSNAVHVAIGDNAARERESRSLGCQRLVTVQHPAASVASVSQIAPGCFIAAQAVVAPGACLDIGVIVNHAAVVDHDCAVGAFSHIAPAAVLGGGVHLGQRVLVGAGAVVQPGLRITDDTVIGSGAVVCSHIDAAGTYIGIPARRVS